MYDYKSPKSAKKMKKLHKESVRLVLPTNIRHRQTPRKYELKKQYSHAETYITNRYNMSCPFNIIYINTE